MSSKMAYQFRTNMAVYQSTSSMIVLTHSGESIRRTHKLPSKKTNEDLIIAYPKVDAEHKPTDAEHKTSMQKISEKSAN